MFLWLGSQVPTEWLNNVFGVADASLITSNIAKIPLFDNVHSKKISSLISHVQRERRHTMKVSINVTRVYSQYLQSFSKNNPLL